MRYAWSDYRQSVDRKDSRRGQVLGDSPQLHPPARLSPPLRQPYAELILQGRQKIGVRSRPTSAFLPGGGNFYDVCDPPGRGKLGFMPSQKSGETKDARGGRGAGGAGERNLGELIAE